MKKLLLLLLALACTATAQTTTIGTAPRAITKTTTGDRLTEDFKVPAGRAVTFEAGSTLTLAGGLATSGASTLAGSVTFTGTISANGATITPTELSYLDGVTQNIASFIASTNASLALKAPLASPAFTTQMTLSGNNPRFDITDNASISGERRWRVSASNGKLSFSGLDEAGVSQGDFLVFNKASGGGADSTVQSLSGGSAGLVSGTGQAAMSVAGAAAFINAEGALDVNADTSMSIRSGAATLSLAPAQMEMRHDAANASYITLNGAIDVHADANVSIYSNADAYFNAQSYLATGSGPGALIFQDNTIALTLDDGNYCSLYFTDTDAGLVTGGPLLIQGTGGITIDGGAVGGTATSASTSGGASKLARTNASGNVNDLIDKTNLSLQFRRGTDAERLVGVPLNGEAWWTTDKKRLWVGDGTTFGGVQVAPFGYSSSYNTVTQEARVAVPALSDMSNGPDGAFISLEQDATSSDGATINMVADYMITAQARYYISLQQMDNGSTLTIGDNIALHAGYSDLTLSTSNINQNKVVVNPYNQTGQPWQGLWVGSDTALYRLASGVLGSENTFRVTSSSTSGRLGGIQSEATTPSFLWHETDASTDNKTWDAIVSGSVLQFRLANDAFSSSNNWMTVGRTGTTPGTVTFPGSTASTTASSGAVVVTGGVGVGGAINATGSVSTAGQFVSNSNVSSSTLTATGVRVNASTTAGGVVQGFGTTADVSFLNRAGTAAMQVLANTTQVQFPGTGTNSGGVAWFGPSTTIANSTGDKLGSVVVMPAAGNSGRVTVARRQTGTWPAGATTIGSFEITGTGTDAGTFVPGAAFTARIGTDLQWGNSAGASGSTAAIQVNAGSTTALTDAMTLTGSAVTIPMSTAANSSSTGALVVTGGVGVGGAVVAGGTASFGALQLNSTPQTTAGRIWYNSDTIRFYGAGERTLVDLSLSQTLSNKTLTAPVLASTSSATDGAVWYTGGAINYSVSGATKVVVSTDQTQTLSNKTLASPTLTGTTSGGTIKATAADGTGEVGGVWSASSIPQFVLKDIDGTTDNKIWRWYLNAEQLRLQLVNDAYSAAASVVTFTRNGNTPGTATWVPPMVFSASNASTSKTSGALVVTGGVGVSGAVNVGGNVSTESKFNVSTASPFAALVANGANVGLSSTNGAVVQGYGSTNDVTLVNRDTNIVLRVPAGTSQVNIPDTTSSSSTTTGALTVGGGVGVAGAVYTGGAVNVGGTNLMLGNAAGEVFSPSNSLVLKANAGFGVSLRVNNSASDAVTVASTGVTTVTASTASTTTGTGALVVTGGLGVGGAINGGATVRANSSTQFVNIDAANRRLSTDGGGPIQIFREGNYASVALTDTSGVEFSRWHADANRRHIWSSPGGVTTYAQINAAGDLQTMFGRAKKVNILTGNFTLDATYHVVVCNSASAFTVTLPTASSNTGREYQIKNKNTGTVTVQGGGNIDGAASTTLGQYQSITLISDGTEWGIY